MLSSHLCLCLLSGLLPSGLLTYLLTYSLHGAGYYLKSWLLLSSLKNIPLSYGIRRFITMLTKARYWTLSWASRIQFAPSIPISPRYTLMLSSHLRLGLPSGLSHVLLPLLRSYQRISPGPRHFETFRNNKNNFYAEGLSAPGPTPKLEDHPLSAVRYFLFNIFAATLRTRRTSLHPQPEDAPCRGDKGLT
jgi:hypothetical protein